MNVWPSSQNFCGWHVSSKLYSDWYSSFPHGRHLVSSFSVQCADRYVPVFMRKTPLICFAGVAHIVPALFRSHAEPLGCFYEAETKLRFSYWRRALWLRGCSSFTHTSLSKLTTFQSFIQISASFALCHIWLSIANEKDWKIIYQVCTCYSIRLSRGTAFGCMVVWHALSATTTKKNDIK